MNSLIALGLATIAGLAGGKIVNKFHIPAVAGYVIIGVCLGSSLSGILTDKTLFDLSIVSALALSFIAFIIGEELEFQTLKKLGKSIILISIFEALIAFILVTIAMWLMTGKLYFALLLGAVASATAPAATLMVLKETKSKGVLTTTLMAVVAIDDAIALILYCVASSLAKGFLTHSADCVSCKTILINPGLEIFGSLLLGVIAGLLLGFLGKRARTQNDLFMIVIGILLLNTGIAKYFHLSELLSNMALGTTVCNTLPDIRHRIFGLTANITPPLYCMFFVLAGARLKFGLISTIGIIGVIYTIVRIMGKVLGAFIGGYLSDAPSAVKKYLGFGLLSQIGVAVGLAIMISQDFPAQIYGQEGVQMSLWVINILLFTTIFTEIIGPVMTKFAVTKAGEINQAHN